MATCGIAAGFEPLAVTARPILRELIGARRRSIAPHVFDVRVAVAAELGNVGGRLHRPETVLLGVRRAEFLGLGIAAVAILAAEPPLPMDIGGKIRFGDEQSQLLSFPHIFVAVAKETLILRRRQAAGRYPSRPQKQLPNGKPERLSRIDQENPSETSHSISPQAVITIKNNHGQRGQEIQDSPRAPAARPDVQKRNDQYHQSAKTEEQHSRHFAFQPLDPADMRGQMFQGLKHEQKIPLGLYSRRGRSKGVRLLPELPGKQGRQRR